VQLPEERIVDPISVPMPVNTADSCSSGTMEAESGHDCEDQDDDDASESVGSDPHDTDYIE
jgi:hypothetical protein